MGFQDVVFLFSEASFTTTTFLGNCGRGERLRTITCPKSVVEVCKGMLPVRYFCFNKASFLSVESHGFHRTVIMLR